MLAVRVIPCLLLSEGGLVKTRRFKDPQYVGDPINAVRIFSDKEADELAILDIGATRRGGPDFDLVRDIASECFMPFSYGGGVTSVEDMARLFRQGAEKVVVNTAFWKDPELVRRAADRFGSQSVVVGMDVKRGLFGGAAHWHHAAGSKGRLSLAEAARLAEESGAGEIFLNSVDRDGMMHGFDLDAVREVAGAVSIPVVACGGAGSEDDLRAVVREAGASAAAAGSLFVFHGKERAVLISYPGYERIQELMR